MAGNLSGMLNVSLERELARGVKGVAIYGARAAADGAATALKNNSDAFTRGLYRAIKKGAISDSRMKAANEALAKQAQTAILSNWKDRLPVKAPGYRAGDNPTKQRLHGYLGKALANAEMTKATTGRAISFLNTGVLWEEARHWHRVNYGAFGPNAQPDRPEEFPVNVNGRTLFTIQDRGKPDPNSWLPRAYIASKDQRSYFAPRRDVEENRADVHGGGHRAALFTDLGFQSVAANLGSTYEAMLRRWVQEEGAEAVRKALHAKGVRVSASVLSG